MEVNFVIPNPQVLDLANQPELRFEDASHPYILFEVVNRSSRTLEEVQVFFMAKGELAELLALDQITFAKLMPGETRPGQLKLIVEPEQVAFFKLQLAAFGEAQVLGGFQRPITLTYSKCLPAALTPTVNEEDEVPVFVWTYELLEVEVVSPLLPSSDHHLEVEMRLTNRDEKMLKDVAVYMAGFRTMNDIFAEAGINVGDLDIGESRIVKVDMTCSTPKLMKVEINAGCTKFPIP